MVITCDIPKEQMQDVLKDGLHLFSSTEELTPDEVKRYDRQIILPQVGSDGQKKLKKSKVLIIGAGGLGAPAALYLAGAGVGTIGIVDADDVSVSNLQRQIIHTSKREGTNKAESAKKSMLELNEHIKVKPIQNIYMRITQKNCSKNTILSSMLWITSRQSS